MTEIAIFTIVSNNYLHFARTLLQSARLHHPEARLYCVIVDTDPAPAAALAEEFEAIALSALPLPDGEDFLFQYTILELNTAVKPWALQYLIDAGFEKVFYIDPDICLYRPMTSVVEQLDGDADIVLTPHLLAPMNDDAHPGELDIRRAGTYNLGFCALRDSPNTRRFLKWWQGKLRHDCIVAPDRGIFVDQSWVDLVPGLFERVSVLRHPGYNVAYWNLAQRGLVGPVENQAALTVNGEPLVFFHFSGLNPLAPSNVSKHQNRYTLDDTSPQVQALFTDYCERVVGNGIHRFSTFPYGFSRFDNGAVITDAQRAGFRADDKVRRRCNGRPFASHDLFDLSRRTGSDAQAHTLALQELSLSPEGRRLQRIYLELLRRPPDALAIQRRLAACATSTGALRTLLSVGASPEARARPGWVRRMGSLAADVGLTPAWVKQRVLQPLLQKMPAPPASAPAAPVPVPAEQLLASLLAPSAGRLSRGHNAPAPGQALAIPAGIHIVGYLKAELGVGEAARSLARACHADGIPFALTDVGYQTLSLQRDTSIFELASHGSYPVDLLYVNADQTPATAARLRTSGVRRGRYTVGFWHWEQPALPMQLLEAFADVDEVWVPSRFVQAAVAAVSPVPVFRVPHAVEFEPTPGVDRSAFGLPARRFLVLVMYDLHSYQYRKNPQAAIAAYRQAVRQCPDIDLVIKTINSGHHADAHAALRESVADLPHVHFIDEFLTRQQTWDLQSSCDMLLSLHRAEGFGLAPAEMMRLGKPVVATGWSANMDFMTFENSMPVDFVLQPLAEDVGAYKAGPLWAEADIGHAARCIVQLASDRDLAARLGRQAALDIRRQLSAKEVGSQIRQRLQMLGHWYPQLLQPF